MRPILFSLLVLILAACTTAEVAPKQETDDTAKMVLSPVSFAALEGWAQDDHAAALVAFKKSCGRIMKAASDKAFSGNIAGGTMADWQPACAAAQTTADAHAFFETYFTPYKAQAEGGSDVGLFTGYYEAALRGSRTMQGAYTTPLHKRPADLVMVELGEFREELKGQRIAGRVLDGKLKPYEDRAKIVAGQWPHNDHVLVWVDDAVDAFFLQIQGSGAVQLDDGSVMRVGYDGQNGHVYYAVGRELVKRGILPKEKVSMQAIRDWIAANPGEAMDFMNLNKSYVFMRELTGEGPLGAENVPLTAGRSLAVDNGKMAYGVPVWLDAGAPHAGAAPVRRLMVSQDTGGAIKGAVRGDVFFGFGPEAERLAGEMKAQGRYWLLLPKTLN